MIWQILALELLTPQALAQAVGRPSNPYPFSILQRVLDDDRSVPEANCKPGGGRSRFEKMLKGSFVLQCPVTSASLFPLPGISTSYQKLVDPSKGL